MKFQSRLKNAIVSALVLGMLISPNQSMAKSDPKAVSGWTNIMGSAASGLIGYLCTDFFVMLGVNIDPAQLALEYMVYDAMKDVTAKWKPKPQKSYRSSAGDNECETELPKEATADMTEEGAQTFEVEVLESVGIEVLGLKNVSTLEQGRQQVVDNLTLLTKEGGNLVLKSDMTQDEYEAIRRLQAENYQKMSTVGVARAELGLETTYQAAVDAGVGDAAGDVTADTSGKDSNIKMVTAENVKPKNINLRSLPSEISSTGMGMRVQSLMNLELAQRINLANTLQGNLLTIQAAGALKNAPRPLRQ